MAKACIEVMEVIRKRGEVLRVREGGEVVKDVNLHVEVVWWR